MPLFTITNTVLIAIMQVGVIVAGVLAAGASQKWWMTNEAPTPYLTTLLLRHGVLALTIPLAWSVLAVSLRRRPDISDGLKTLTFLAGILILIALAVIIVYAIARPWFDVDWSLGRSPDP